jgi:hypothetical protein
MKNGEVLGHKGHQKRIPSVKKMKIHEVLFIGWQVTGVRSNALPAFERTSYLWSNARRAFDRK